MGDLDIELFHVDNGDGWRLALRRYVDPETLVEGRRPVTILPGYGMNGFIFTYHPEGPSMAETFARQGFEFWTVDLRAQGDSIPVGGSRSYTMEQVGTTDLPVVVDHILGHTRTGCDRVDMMGCSLGATYVYLYAGLAPRPLIGSMVSIGGPLRWLHPHPAIRVAFSSPTLVGLVPFWGTGLLAEKALPLLADHAPWMLRFYLRAEHVDLSKADVFTRTVEDPVPAVNAQIARWMRNVDLMVDGVNLSEALARFDGPYLCVYSNADGIVDRDSAVSAFDKVSSRDKEIIALGTAEIPMAHADIYISRHSHRFLFEPVMQWLIRVQS